MCDSPADSRVTTLAKRDTKSEPVYRWSEKVQDKGRGSLWRPRPVNTAPQSGSGTRVRGSVYAPWGQFGGLPFLKGPNHW